MKKTTKKMLSFLLALVMTASLFAGCGSKDATSEAGTEEGSKAPEASADSGELDTIKILTIDASKPIDSGGMLYLSDWVEGGQESKIWDQFTSELAEIGIQLEVDLIPEDQYETVLQTKTVAGLDEYDLVMVDTMDDATKKNLIDNGTFVALDEVYENYSDGTAKEFFTTGDEGFIYDLNKSPDGKNYFLLHTAICDYKGDTTSGVFRGSMIRQDWLDKLGLSLPTTTDELYDTLVAFQEQDANENGAKDEMAALVWGAGEKIGFGNGFAQMFGLTTQIVGHDPETNSITSPFYQEGVKDYFAYMNKLYSEGLLDVSGQYDANMSENKYGVVYDWFVTTWTEAKVTLLPEGAAPVQYVGVAANAYPGEKTFIDKNIGCLSGSDKLAITSGADLEVIGRYLDYVCTDEFAVFSEYGIEGYNYDLEDGIIVRKSGDTVEQEVFSKHQNFIGNTIVPRYEQIDLVVNVEQTQDAGMTLGFPEEGFKEKAEACSAIYEDLDNYYMIYNSPETVMAKATDEETAAYTAVITDLETYCDELILNLIIGEASLDNWDSYIEDLKELGLDEVIDIYQARYDRVNG